MVGAVTYLLLTLVSHRIPHCYNIHNVLNNIHCPCVGEILTQVMELFVSQLVRVSHRDLDPQCGDVMGNFRITRYPIVIGLIYDTSLLYDTPLF